MGYKAKKNQLEKLLEDDTASVLRADPSSVWDSYHGYDRKDSQRAYLTEKVSELESQLAERDLEIEELKLELQERDEVIASIGKIVVASGRSR